MAATQAAPDTVQSDSSAVAAPLLLALKSVFDQFSSGIITPTIAFTDISQLGGEPLDIWKGIIEYVR